MEQSKAKYQTIDEYIATFPEHIQVLLGQMRAAIHSAAPEATEKISYQMPTFALKGNLVHFAAWKEHIGFYPASSGIDRFAQELAAYDGAKGTIKFPIGQPLPLDLVQRIVRFRVEENLAAAAEKAARKKANRAG